MSSKSRKKPGWHELRFAVLMVTASSALAAMVLSAVPGISEAAAHPSLCQMQLSDPHSGSCAGR